MIYRISFQPLEPYSFGEENGFAYLNGEERIPMGRSSYLVHSKRFPEQSTILGTIRHKMIEAGDDGKQYKTDISTYTVEEWKKIASWVGSESYQMGKDKQNFGCLKGISPVFLWKKGTRDHVIPLPACCVPADHGKVVPMKMSKDTVTTSEGEVHWPENYDAKEGCARGFVELNSGEVLKEETVFKRSLFYGNRLSSNGRSEALFGREVWSLSTEYSFAVYAEVNEVGFPWAMKMNDMIALMGLKHSSFLMKVEKVEDCSSVVEMLKRAVEDSPFFSEDYNGWRIALSDLLEAPKYNDCFCVIQKKMVRTLRLINRTAMAAGRYVRSETQKNVLAAGSAFYLPDDFSEAIVPTVAGYDCIIRLGGKK